MALSRVIRSYFRTTPIRSFAKKRKGEDEEEAIDLPELSIEPTKQEMHKAIEWLESQLLNLKVGRADPRVYEEVIVPSSHVSLKTLGQAIPRSTNEVMFKVFDAKNSDNVIDALKASTLQVTARKEANGNVIITIPRPSAEYKAKLIKQTKALAEDAKNIVRKHRHTALQSLKAYKHISKDDIKHFQTEVQGLTDKQIDKIVSMVLAKETQLEEH
jgi:ribosome recycling factor